MLPLFVGSGPSRAGGARNGSADDLFDDIPAHNDRLAVRFSFAVFYLSAEPLARALSRVKFCDFVFRGEAMGGLDNPPGGDFNRGGAGGAAGDALQWTIDADDKDRSIA
jgi:hypothetical protein